MSDFEVVVPSSMTRMCRYSLNAVNKSLWHAFLHSFRLSRLVFVHALESAIFDSFVSIAFRTGYQLVTSLWLSGTVNSGRADEIKKAGDYPRLASRGKEASSAQRKARQKPKEHPAGLGSELVVRTIAELFAMASTRTPLT